MKRIAIVALMLFAFALPASGQTKYGATVMPDKATDFTKIKTYVWQPGWDANDKKAHALIVAAVDRELKTLGLEKKTAGPSDVIVKYASLRRIDVDLTAKPVPEQPRRQIDVGSLVVLMLDPASGKELLRARVDKQIELDPNQAEAIVNSAVAELFAQYPTRVKK